MELFFIVLGIAVFVWLARMFRGAFRSTPKRRGSGSSGGSITWVDGGSASSCGGGGSSSCGGSSSSCGGGGGGCGGGS